MTEVRIPSSTYRIQFGRDLRFVDVSDLIPYLHSLGITDLYTSPRFAARRGSTHGYDIANPRRVNSELGTEDEFSELCEKLKQYRMGLILDIVPNHMAASHENPWWMDVMEHGPSSPYAKYFDIDWHPVTPKAALLQESRVLLPILGDLYGSELEARRFSLSLEETGFVLRYYERRFPLDAGTWGDLLQAAINRLEAKSVPNLQIAGGGLEQDVGNGGNGERLARMNDALELAGKIPPRTETSPAKIKRRRKLTGDLKRLVFAEYRDHPEGRAALEEAMRDVDGDLDRLHALLDAQAYRLASWRIAFEEINYRRFFDINDLVRLRVEDEDVFRDRHESMYELLNEGKATGFRVDHVDGLRNPEEYLAQLQEGAGRPVYTIVEKILGYGESLADSWRVWGTTGYDFLNVMNDVQVRRSGLEELEKTYAGARSDTPFAELCRDRKRQVMWKAFSGDAICLGHELARLASEDRKARDVPVSELTNALVEVTSCLPVYRTYVTEHGIDTHARGYVEFALAEARRRKSELELSTPALEFLRRVLLAEPVEYAIGSRPRYLDFTMRWQMFTGPVMAKGLEDTAFYVDNVLISRNEVGGDAVRESPPPGLEEFHSFLRERFVRWPHTINATSTHDTKRSEDARARINVLSEAADEWARRVADWSVWNDRFKDKAGELRTPTRNEEELFYQSLLGIWPLDEAEVESISERMQEFVVKAAREAKDYTGWIRKNEAHESALVEFVKRVLDETPDNRFLPDFRDFVKKVGPAGAMNSLAMVVVKLTAPGVPDIFQGMELWEFSLVDPDNRRAVDFRRRLALFDELKRGQEDRGIFIGRLTTKWGDGAIKMYVTHRGLDFRRENKEGFESGDYLPLAAEGERAKHLIAFARRAGEWWSVTIVPRWTMGLVQLEELRFTEDAWGDTRVVLPEGAPERWRNVLTEEEHEGLRVGEVLGAFPVGLLEGMH